MRAAGYTAAIVMATAAGSASAQCSWFVPDVPDFDQRRTTTAQHPGLPGNGSMYCAPTAFTNWMAYLANRGISQPNTLDGPRDWESAAEYDRVTSVLVLVGTLMGTSASEGTKAGFVPGARSYADLFANGDLIVGKSSLFADGFTPTVQDMKAAHDLGGHIIAGYGFFSSSTGGIREGGHAITVTGVWDLACGAAPILQFNDPASDGENASQSDFRTNLAALTPVTGLFSLEAGAPPVPATLLRMDISAPSRNFIDTLVFILPANGLLGGLTDQGTLELVTPFRPQGSLAQPVRTFHTPSGTGVVLDMAAGPNPLSHYYLCARAGPQPAGVWRVNTITGVSTRLTTGHVNPSRICIGRLGDVYVIDGDTVYRYTPGAGQTPTGSFTPSLPPAAIAYNDLNDTLSILSEPPTIGPRRLYTFPRTLSGFGTNRAMPIGLTGAVWIGCDQEDSGAHFVCGDETTTLYRVAYNSATSSLEVTDSITHAAGVSLSHLSVLDGNRLIYASNGVLVEKVRNSQGNWVNRAGSRWAGRSAPNGVSIARSRDAHTATMDGPGFNNLSNPTAYPALPACYANCDDSTSTPMLNVNDFICFQNRFAAQHPYANCDLSTSTPVLNVNDFICFQNRFAAGCS
ncbi:MAG: hypothetical protein JNM80_06625 [Phycisphaerae bacterium]|nr:hypothetical protein [Phycisphaerae bacterium]